MRLSRRAKLWGYGIYAVFLGGLIFLTLPGYIDERRGADVEATVTEVVSPYAAQLRFVTADGVECTVEESWGHTEHFLEPGDRITIRHGRVHPCTQIQRAGGELSIICMPLVMLAAGVIFWIVTGFAWVDGEGMP